jgi:DNA sulfur modification protein DndD
MRYTKLTLENFRVFHEKHEINFPKEDGIFLIHALNGVGKSAIYHALRYVFFGKSLDQQTREAIDVINLLSIPAYSEKTYNFKVSLEFEHEGIAYELTRRHQAKSHFKTSTATKPTEDSHFEQSISFIMDGDVVDEKNAKYEIDNLLREEIADFFIVDNEHIGDLNQALKGSSSEIIKKSIDSTIGISILEQGMNDLSSVYQKLAGNLSKEIKKNKENEKDLEVYNQRTDLYKSSQISLSKLKDEEEIISKKVEELTKLRNKYSDIEKNVNEANNLEEKLKSLENQKSSRFEKIQELVIEEWYLPVFIKAQSISNIQTKLLEKQNQKNNEIANKKIEIKNFKDGLKNQKCFHCKQSLPASQIKKQETQLQNAEKQLEVLEKNAKPEKILPHPEAINKFMQVNPKFLNELEKEYYQFLTDISRAEKELKKINEKLSSGDNAEVRKVQKDFQESQLELRELITKVKTQEDVVKTNKKLLDEATRKMNKNSTGDSILSQIVDITGNLQGLLEKSHEDFSDSARKGVALYASEAFDQLSNYKDIKIGIDEDYVFQLQDKDKESIGVASMGQSRVAAVALIAGLNAGSVTKAPILIDSPMVGLDEIHQKNLYSFFPKLSDQIVLLVPPGEWNEEMHRKHVKKSISGEITLEKVEETKLKVHEGYKKSYLTGR